MRDLGTCEKRTLLWSCARPQVIDWSSPQNHHICFLSYIRTPAANDVHRLKLWRAAGVNMNVVDESGFTCLHVAIFSQQTGV